MQVISFISPSRKAPTVPVIAYTARLHVLHELWSSLSDRLECRGLCQCDMEARQPPCIQDFLQKCLDGSCQPSALVWPYNRGSQAGKEPSSLLQQVQSMPALVGKEAIIEEIEGSSLTDASFQRAYGEI